MLAELNGISAGSSPELDSLALVLSLGLHPACCGLEEQPVLRVLQTCWVSFPWKQDPEPQVPAALDSILEISQHPTPLPCLRRATAGPTCPCGFLSPPALTPKSLFCCLFPETELACSSMGPTGSWAHTPVTGAARIALAGQHRPVGMSGAPAGI